MRIIRKQHIIFALFATCNFVCCNAAQCKTANDINPPTCDFKDLENKVLINICKRVGYHHKPNPTRKQLVKGAQLCFEMQGLNANSIGNDYDSSTRTLSLEVSEQLDEILEDIDEYRDEVDRDVAWITKHLYLDYLDMMEDPSFLSKSIHYRISYLISMQDIDDAESKLAMRNYLLARLEIEYVPTPDEIAKLPKWEEKNIMIGLYEGETKLFQKDNTIVGASWYIDDKTWYKLSEIQYTLWDYPRLVRKSTQYDHIIMFSMDLPGEGRQKLLAGYNTGDDPLVTAQDVIDEYNLDITDDAYMLKDIAHRIKTFLPDLPTGKRFLTPKDIAKLPDWDSKHPGIGLEMKIFQRGGKAVTSVWNAKSQTWSRPEELAEPYSYYDQNDEGHLLIYDLITKSIKYEHVFPLTTRADGNKQTVVIGYNYGDDPLIAAHRVIEEYKLGMHASRHITEFIEKKVSEFRPTTSPQTFDQSKIQAYWISYLFLVIAMIGFICSLSYALQRKRSPKKVSPLTCHQPVMKKTIYVKSLAIKRLNQGKRLNGIVTRSRARDIQIERKTGQSTVMYKIKSSNGETYVHVHVEGSKESIEKAVELIREAVGKENLDEEIELQTTTPPTQKAARHPKKVSSSTPPKKKKESLSSALWSSVCAHCQSLKEISINKRQSTRNIWTKKTMEGSGTRIWITVIVIYAILCCAVKLNVVCMISRGIDDEETHCQRDIRSGEIAYDSLYFLVLGAIFYNLLVDKHMQTSKFDLVIFGSLYCVFLFAMEDGCEGNGRERNDKCVKVVAGLMNLFVAILLTRRLWKRLCPMLALAFGIISGVLRMPFEMYHAKKIKHTIYVKSSKSKNLSRKQGRKKNEIIQKSGVEDIQIDNPAVGDNYIPIHMAGSRRSVWKAIELIQEDIGTEHVSITKPPNTMSVQESVSATVNTSEPQPNQKSTTESPVQCETKNASGNKLARESTAVESPFDTAVQEEEEEEEVPSEIGINSTQGMTRETITEASMSSLNDRSSISKAYSSFTLNDDDPLLIFLRSQASCIKGSVDEFYTWLVKSEDIDSMMALKEAVNEDGYLNDMKVGDGGGSGVKGFKRKAFLRAISEYFNDESDAKSTAEEHQSLPQCQKKNPSETLEPPEELVCPISLNLLTDDPVLAADSITYERASIEDWFEKSKAKIRKARENLKQNPQSEADQRVVNNGICSPVYGSKLESLVVTPNTSVRNMARAYKEKMTID